MDVLLVFPSKGKKKKVQRNMEERSKFQHDPALRK